MSQGESGGLSQAGTRRVFVETQRVESWWPRNSYQVELVESEKYSACQERIQESQWTRIDSLSRPSALAESGES